MVARGWGGAGLEPPTGAFGGSWAHLLAHATIKTYTFEIQILLYLKIPGQAVAKGLAPRASPGEMGTGWSVPTPPPYSGVQEFKGCKQRAPPKCESVSSRAPACAGHPWSAPSGVPPGVTWGFPLPRVLGQCSLSPSPHRVCELLWALLCPGLCCPRVVLPCTCSVTCPSEAMEFYVHCAWQATSRCRVLGGSKARGLL